MNIYDKLSYAAQRKQINKVFVVLQLLHISAENIPSGACFIRCPASKASPSLHRAFELMWAFPARGTTNSDVCKHQASSNHQVSNFWGSQFWFKPMYVWCTVTCCGPQAWRFNTEGDQERIVVLCGCHQVWRMLVLWTVYSIYGYNP